MAATVSDGAKWFTGGRDREGHRTYKVLHHVKTASGDGPAIVMDAPGLPLIGSIYLVDNDIDSWAFCTPERKVDPTKPQKIGDQPTDWTVETTFSTRSPKRCQDTTIEDPLQEPDRLSGSFVKYTREVTKDRNGLAVKTSSHEVFRGPQVEFDHNFPTVVIEQNLAALGLATFTSMIDTVNDATLWGLATRKIKLSNVSWERKLFGVCDFYFVRTLEFDIDFNTFDRSLLNEGTMALDGHYDKATKLWVTHDKYGANGTGEPNASNPSHFTRYKDVNGEIGRTMLGLGGTPLGTGSEPVYFDLEYYGESNFFLLGVPAEIE
ncbi:hypothetical protein OAG36_00665 [bacterium]|nr:hypothetical protein [bacterium]